MQFCTEYPHPPAVGVPTETDRLLQEILTELRAMKSELESIDYRLKEGISTYQQP